MSNKPNDTLGVTDAHEGLPAGWDWKGEYVQSLAGGDGLERFSQGSATPDTTLMFAGPARFTGIAGDTSKLQPIGLLDSFSYMSQAQLQRMFEIGSNRSFFTRGKTISQLQISAMLADQASLLKVLSGQAYSQDSYNAGNYQLNASGTKAPGVQEDNLFTNLDSEALAVPFGILLVFKTKGSPSGQGNSRGTILGATYLEYCMLQGFQFNVQSQSPVIAENVSVEFDRAVPVALNAGKS